MSPAVDCIIVGAGAAGLRAGVDLARAGLRVVILEARDRVGGRILTRHYDAPLELGAEFIHGLPESTWAVVREAKLAASEVGGTPYRFHEGTVRRADDEPASASQILDALGDWLGQHPPGFDVSFAEYLRAAHVSGEQARRASRYVEGFNAADQEHIGVAALIRQQDAEARIQADRLFHLVAGYDSLPHYLAQAFLDAGGDLRLQQCVRSIEWRRDDVVVSGERGLRLSGRRAIVTLPLGILKSQAVDFAPDLPALTSTLRGLAMGPVLRVSLLFRRAFWRTMAPDMHFLFSPEQPLPTWWTTQPADVPLLTGWIGGESAIQRAQALTGDALVEAALQQLREMFHLPRGEPRRSLLAAECHDWQKDPLSQGAYSYACVGGVDASSRLAVPVENTIFLAGEHTDTDGHWGTVHAALGSGTRAARQILSSA